MVSELSVIFVNDFIFHDIHKCIYVGLSINVNLCILCILSKWVTFLLLFLDALHSPAPMNLGLGASLDTGVYSSVGDD